MGAKQWAQKILSNKREEKTNAAKKKARHLLICLDLCTLRRSS
jgi:hypothetical protein